MSESGRDSLLVLIQEGQALAGLAAGRPGAVAQEVGLVLDEGVVTDVQDTGLCLITGVGRTFRPGDVLPYPEREGVPGRVNGKRFPAPGTVGLPA
ncbi:putative protein OS=Streptomyces griseomycini OX=66895 GN=FHS37_002697 PE=4 SV=1 [Streptomyces griseomycini]|nr:hypothetical protein GCM10015536_26770 [Streptomyces griseomycini]